MRDHERAQVNRVTELEHTADAGLLVRATNMPELFERAAAAAVALAQGDEAGRSDVSEERVPGTRSVELQASAEASPLPDDPSEGADEGIRAWHGVELLLARWLTEILYLLEVQHFEARDVTFSLLEPRRLRAVVHGVEGAPPGVREIKGVTYHGLEVSPDGEGWRARVIFDL